MGLEAASYLHEEGVVSTLECIAAQMFFAKAFLPTQWFSNKINIFKEKKRLNFFMERSQGI